VREVYSSDVVKYALDGEVRSTPLRKFIMPKLIKNKGGPRVLVGYRERSGGGTFFPSGSEVGYSHVRCIPRVSGECDPVEARGSQMDKSVVGSWGTSRGGGGVFRLMFKTSR